MPEKRKISENLELCKKIELFCKKLLTHGKVK